MNRSHVTSMETVMNVVGKLVFVSLSSKYKNDKEQTLALIKIDRLSKNNSGLNPLEYSLIMQTPKQEQNFISQLDNKTPLEILDEIQKERNE